MADTETTTQSSDGLLDTDKLNYNAIPVTNNLIGAINKAFTIRNMHEIAEDFFKVQPLYYTKAKIWWLWDFTKSKWIIIDEVDIMILIDIAAQQKKGIPPSDTIKANIRNQLIEALKRKARANAPQEMKQTYIQFKNKIIDIKTGDEQEVTPKLFATNPIPWDIGSSEETPILDKLFEDWAGKEFQQTLYEIIAYCLLPSYPLSRVFCFNGDGSNGKSSFLNVISKFLGMENVTSSDLDMLLGTNSRFEKAKLYRKLACVLGETNFDSLNKTSTFKMLTGQDPISFEFKGKDPFDGCNYAKILMATNRLPLTHDKSKGFYRRWLIIDFPNQFTEKRDILEEIPEQEFKNLAKKSIHILKELLEKREFTNEGTIEQRRMKYEETANPLKSFLERHCEEDAEGLILTTELLKRFNKTMESLKKQRITDRRLGKMIEDAGLERETNSERDINGKLTSKRYLKGYKWKQEPVNKDVGGLDDFV